MDDKLSVYLAEGKVNIMNIDMHKVNAALNQASDSEREADASLYGYFYQVDQTLMRVLKNKNTDKVVLIEVLEDILEYGTEAERVNSSIEKKPIITAYQIKHHNNNVTNSTSYKPLLLGFISYLRVKNEFNKINAKINKDYKYKYKIVYGIPSGKNISVDKSQALKTIMDYAPFDKNYTKFASIWKANKDNKVLNDYSEEDIKEYLSCTEITSDSDIEEYSSEVINEITMKIHGVVELENISSEDLYYIMWTIIKEFMLDGGNDKKAITFELLIQNTKKIIKETSEQYKYRDIYYLEKIKELIHNDIESILCEIYESVIDENEEIYNLYSNCYSKIIESFIIKNFDNDKYRYSFINSLVPDDILDKVDNLVDEYELFMRNNIYIISYLRILLKIAFCQNIDTEFKMREKFKIDNDIWKIVQLDERGNAILISFRDDMTDNKVGHIANKMNKINQSPDVWYMKNSDDYCSSELYDYKVDITRPRIKAINECKVGSPTNYFTIECMKCLNTKDFANLKNCSEIHKMGCLKIGKR